MVALGPWPVLNDHASYRPATMGPEGDEEAGILDRHRAATSFAYRRHRVDARLAGRVLNLWTVSWDLDQPYTARVLPLPCVNLSVTDTEADVTGVVTTRYERHLTGRGYAVGARFRPGCFRPHLDGPVAALTDRHRPIVDVLGRDTTPLARAVAATDDADERVGLLADFLADLPVEPDPLADRMGDVVGRVSVDPGIVRVGQIADLAGTSVRTLQRRFAEYVGIGPKWLIQRRRILEAAVRAGDPIPPDWAELAARLGFADQSHLVREFAATVGAPPAAYARQVAGPPGDD